MKRITLTATIFLLTVLTVRVQAQSVPPLVNYQGYLTDANGDPIADTTAKLEFNLYDAANNGNLIWGPQIFDGVPVVKGRFNVILGSTDNNGMSIADAFNSGERYLGIKMDDQVEISPRQRILSAPYAIQAGNTPIADEAIHAINADHATHADQADNATNAQNAAHATNADHATSSDDGIQFGDTYWTGWVGGGDQTCGSGYVVDGFSRRCRNNDCQYGGSWDHRIRCRKIQK